MNYSLANNLLISFYIKNITEKRLGRTDLLVKHLLFLKGNQIMSRTINKIRNKNLKERGSKGTRLT